MTPFTTKCIVTNLYLASTTTLCEPSCFKLTSSPTTQLSSWQMWWQKQMHWSQPTWQTNSLQAPQNQQLKNKSIGWDTEIKLCREPATCHWCSDQKGLHPWKQCLARGKTCSECGIMTTSAGCAWQMENHSNDEDLLPHPINAPELPTTSPATGETIENVMKPYTTSNSARMDPQTLHPTLMTPWAHRYNCQSHSTSCIRRLWSTCAFYH